MTPPLRLSVLLCLSVGACVDQIAPVRDTLRADLRVPAFVGEPDDHWHPKVVAAAVIDEGFHFKKRDLATLDRNAWRHRFEAPYLLWNFALGAAGRRCADGGTVVAVAQSPAALDAPGHTPELAIADGVLALVRSIAAAEGPRGVRANLVTTPIDLIEGDLVAPAPPLAGFPGTIETHVAGAVRSFLGTNSAGLTGRVLSADGGRSL